MAKNKVQFQRGLSLTQFLSQYGTEEQCRSVLFRMRWPRGFRQNALCRSSVNYPPRTSPILEIEPSQWLHPNSGTEYDEFKVFKWINTMIGNVKNAIHGTYHAVSEKHLPRYLAEFCYRFNRRFQLHEMVNRLVYVALRTPPMPQRLLRLAEVRW